MDSSDLVGPVAYSLTTTHNRSLSPTGRLLFLALIFFNTLIIALGCALVGAWPVLPFAGLELLAVVFAFRLISLHDGDYERLTITGCTVRLESSNLGEVKRFESNTAWVQLVCRTRRGGRVCELALRSHGREVPIGRFMSDAQRIAWARELAGCLRIASN